MGQGPSGPPGRNAYLAALDRASIDLDIKPFAAFISERVRWSMEQATEKAQPAEHK